MKKFIEDHGNFLVIGDEIKPVRHLVDKTRVKKFKNKEEKIAYRKELFWSFQNHAHYGKWFATDKKKGVLFGPMYDYIEKFIEKHVDLDHNDWAIELRNTLVRGELKQFGKNWTSVDEIIAVVGTRIRYDEEAIVDLPYIMKGDPMDIYKKTIAADRAKYERINQNKS